jgi:hypothetical protein
MAKDSGAKRLGYLSKIERRSDGYPRKPGDRRNVSSVSVFTPLTCPLESNDLPRFSRRWVDHLERWDPSRIAAVGTQGEIDSSNGARISVKRGPA